MAAFDADAFLAARIPWVLVLEKRRYRAAWVSIEHVLAFDAEVKAKDPKALPRFLRRMFPWRLAYLWRGDPARRVLRLDPEARKAVLADFFVWRATELQRENRTNGTGPQSFSSPPIEHVRR